jgi:hypothetical protein
MVKKIHVSATMTVGELIRNFENLFHDPTENTYTNLDVMCADGSATCLHERIKELSQNPNFDECIIKVSEKKIFEATKKFKEKAGLHVMLDYQKNSLVM